MTMTLAVVGIVHVILVSLSSSFVTSASDAPHLDAGSGTPPSEQTPLRLTQINPVERNHFQDFKFQSGQVIKIKTLAKQPPLFEIADFLSAEECDHIKRLAVETGLYQSTLKQDGRDEGTEEEEGKGTTRELFLDMDANQDEVLDVYEVLDALDAGINAFLRPEDALQMFHDLHLDANGDGVLCSEEFANIDEGKMDEIREWTAGHSEDESRLSRVSQQAWLSQEEGSDKVLTDLRQRVDELAGLPQGIVEHSEKLQVVYYEPGGHFHAHYDSEAVDPTQHCSHTSPWLPDEDNPHHESMYRLCRFITILYYLDDTLEGGETAFPVADNETFSEEDLNLSAYDLSRHCHDANVYVKPEKGKAIMWYNHYINSTTGWLGPMDPYSLHGGCDVRRGTKWIANNWITVDDSRRRQVLYMQVKASQNQQVPSSRLQSVEPDDDGMGFPQAVGSLRDILMDCARSSAGIEAFGLAFGEGVPPEDIVDLLVEYTAANAAEIQVAHGDDDEDTEGNYRILWLHEAARMSMPFHQEAVITAEQASHLLMTCTQGSRDPGATQRTGCPEGGTVHVWKNPRLTADSSEDPDRYPDHVQDESVEVQPVDEL